jgi:hypothetical protein
MGEKLKVADPDRDPSASLIERVIQPLAAAAVERAKTGKAIPWALVVAFVTAVGGMLGWQYVDAHDGCDPLVVQHVLHQAAEGAAQADTLDGLGHPEVADAIRSLTDIDNQPDDVRLCVLVQQRGER